ncbi:MAG TPA: DUF6311 domain-containing protein [Devosia sp.]|nr:DUF6311 domain-containing protein [Devosia sp.]
MTASARGKKASGSEIAGLGAAAAFGVVAFFVWAGWTILDPGNVGWLRVGDRAMHTLGWWFFRVTPWGWPLGVSPRNGLEISSSVALSDSLPLFAIPFKLLSPLLPKVFQYWGLWFLLSMVLQGVFGYLIGRSLRLSRPVSVLLGAALVMTPAFLFRLPFHMALAGHWVLLCAIWLYVKEPAPRRFAWPLLIVITSMVHVYLLAMVFALWLAALVQRLWLGRLDRTGAVVELVAGIALCLVTLWAMGFFMTSSLGAEGFGLYKMNLSAFFDPNKWSWLWPDLPNADGDYEGLSFPGLGVLLLLALGLGLAWRRVGALVSPRWLPLLVVAVGGVVFAISNKPALGHWEIGTIPLPGAVLDFASMFRASGRMVWPAAYLAAVLAFVLLARRLAPRPLLVLTAAALVLQIADTSKGWTEFAATRPAPSPTWPTRIKSAFWDFAARHYDKVRAIPVEGINRNWAELSFYAAFHGMSSDAAYLGRLDADGYWRLKAMARAALTEGALEPDALYVLDGPSAQRIRPFMRPGDMLVNVDGFIVFGRNGRDYAQADGFKLPQADRPWPPGAEARLATTAGADTRG